MRYELGILYYYQPVLKLDKSPEAERLLPDEEQLSQPVYGSTDEDLLSEPDPEEVKRQQEALERICAEAARSVPI